MEAKLILIFDSFVPHDICNNYSYYLFQQIVGKAGVVDFSLIDVYTIQTTFNRYWLQYFFYKNSMYKLNLDCTVV